MKPVLVIGHRNPDTDSICSAICYAHLKQILTGREHVACRAGQVNAETAYVLDCFGVEPGTPALSCSELLTPSSITIEAMERSVVLALPAYALYPYLQNNLNLMRIYNQMLWVSLKEHWENKMAMVQYSAMERYQWFLRRYPGVIDRVPHRHVASFLGITPVSLSRIRR